MTDHDETMHCYRHPDRETALSCGSCERPICVDCSVTAAVGIKCRECAKLPRAALATVPHTRLVTAVIAGVLLALVGAMIVDSVRFGFFLLLIGYFVGMGVAEAIRKSSGGYRDHALARVAMVSAAAIFLLPVVFDVIRFGAGALDNNVFMILAGVLAAVSAYNRAI